MIVGITDLNGNIDNLCITSTPIDVPVIPVNNPVFYSVDLDVYNVNIQVNTHQPQANESAHLLKLRSVPVAHLKDIHRQESIRILFN